MAKINKMCFSVDMALACIAAATLAGCRYDSATRPTVEENGAVEGANVAAGSAFQVADKRDSSQAADPVLKALAAAGNWERAQLAAIKRQAENDPSWYAKDGERYQALYVTGDGVVYGRRGGAPKAPVLQIRSLIIMH
jgi:hypothetical protein